MALRVVLEDPVKVADCFLKSLGLEMGLTNAEQERRNHLIGPEKTNGTVMFFAVRVQGDQSRRPLEVEVRGMGLSVKLHPQRDKVGHNKLGYGIMRIRDRIHLFAADSIGVEEIKQHFFVLGFRPSEGFVEICFPFNLCGHEFLPYAFY